MFNLDEMYKIYHKPENKDKIILDLCGGTGSWSRPYKEAGYDVHVITLPDYDVTQTSFHEDSVYFHHKDYLDPNFALETKPLVIAQEKIYGILAAPPCTMFSRMRNDKTAKKTRNIRQGIKVVNACLKVIHECLYRNFRYSKGLKFWALENPATGYLKRFLGKPALVFNPCDYGDPYIKQTALWGEFNEPNKNPVEPRKKDINGKRINFVENVYHFKDIKQIPIEYKKRTKIDSEYIMRSMTPEHFAFEFFKANL